MKDLYKKKDEWVSGFSPFSSRFLFQWKGYSYFEYSCSSASSGEMIEKSIFYQSCTWEAYSVSERFVSQLKYILLTLNVIRVSTSSLFDFQSLDRRSLLYVLRLIVQRNLFDRNIDLHTRATEFVLATRDMIRITTCHGLYGTCSCGSLTIRTTGWGERRRLLPAAGLLLLTFRQLTWRRWPGLSLLTTSWWDWNVNDFHIIRSSNSTMIPPRPGISLKSLDVFQTRGEDLNIKRKTEQETRKLVHECMCKQYMTRHQPFEFTNVTELWCQTFETLQTLVHSNSREKGLIVFTNVPSFRRTSIYPTCTWDRIVDPKARGQRKPCERHACLYMCLNRSRGAKESHISSCVEREWSVYVATRFKL